MKRAIEIITNGSLVTNFNTTMAALATEEANLRRTVHELPEVLEAAQPALDSLNASFPSARAWALEMIPGVEETPAGFCFAVT